MRQFFRDYSLSLVLAALWLVFWALQTWAGWHEFQNESLAHHQIAQVWGEGGYVWTWLEATNENLQSECFQLFTFVVLSSFLFHKGSPQSKDSSEEDSERLGRLLIQLEERLKLK